MRFVRSTALLLLLAGPLLLSACGQSGALFIPGDPSQMSVPPAAPDATSSNDEDANAAPPDSDNGN